MFLLLETTNAVGMHAFSLSHSPKNFDDDSNGRKIIRHETPSFFPIQNMLVRNAAAIGMFDVLCIISLHFSLLFLDVFSSFFWSIILSRCFLVVFYLHAIMYSMLSNVHHIRFSDLYFFSSYLLSLDRNTLNLIHRLRLFKYMISLHFWRIVEIAQF